MIAEESERLHLSLDDIKRLTHEAREAIKAQQREEQRWTSAVVLDPKTNPELAVQQWRLLVSQLQMLSQAAGPQVLANQLQTTQPHNEVCLRVLESLQATQPFPAPAV